MASLSPLRSLNNLKQLHSRLIVTSLHTKNPYAALLIHNCTILHASAAYTNLIFTSVKDPNANVFSNFIKFLYASNNHRQTLVTFLHSRNPRIPLDFSVFPILIRSSKNKSLCASIHAEIVKCGHGGDRFTRNSLLVSYARFGDIEVARREFDEIGVKHVVDWNAMIGGYWDCGRESDARKLFDEMPERNVCTWNTMVSGYGRVSDLNSSRIFFDAMPEKDIVSWNAMLKVYAQYGFTSQALELFNSMTRIKPDQTTFSIIISVCTWHGDLNVGESIAEKMKQLKLRPNKFVKAALIDMYAKCGRLDTAQKIFDSTQIRDRTTNFFAWNAMIAGYTRVGNLGSAREIFNRMPERDVVSWNSMIAGYTQNGQSAFAIKLFKEMTKPVGNSNPKPNEVTMLNVIAACAHLGALEEGREVVKWMTKNGLKLGRSGKNSLIYMYSKCGSHREAQKVFDEMGGTESRNVVSYNCLIAGFAAHGHGSKALKSLHEMKDLGIKPDEVTFVSILAACSHSGLIQEGMEIFESIEKPCMNHYACVVDMLGRVGKLDEAWKIMETMPMAPSPAVYGALLNACRIHKKIEMAEFVAEKLFAIEPQNSGNYILLCNMYAAAGRWGDMERIRDLMKVRGVKKVHACSWMEFGGRVHTFRTGDDSHDLSAEIYRVLGELRKKMRVLGGYEADVGCALKDVEEEEKEEMVGTHSEKLAVAFGLLVSEAGSVIRVVKNLRICDDCHVAMKMISKLEKREIILRDNSRFHCFNDGLCSCGDYW